MIKIRLIRLLGSAWKYIVYQIFWQWLSLLGQVVIVWRAAVLFAHALSGRLVNSEIISTAVIVIAGIAVRYLCDRMYARSSYFASADVKRVLRNKIYEKMLRLGSSYRDYVNSAEIVQMAGEGVEQLETYFGRYLSQFFYALLAPITLFLVLMPISLKVSLILLVAVPLIPIVIMVVMIVARKILADYFDIYYGLVDHFLEKLQGMTTLKIYQADGQAAEEMDEESERFRKITMKVLSMQLNSTSIMDIIAYGGAAIGIIAGLQSYAQGAIDVSGMIMIVLLGAEFFLPMRLLGSFFHIGMNGMKASDNIFAFLDLEEPEHGHKDLTGNDLTITMKHLSFSYDTKRTVIKDINIDFKSHSFTSIVGESGSGKSTIAAILMGQHTGYKGKVMINGLELGELSEAALMKHITLVGYNSWIFAGTVRDNLLMGKPDAVDSQLIKALKDVNLWTFLSSQQGLDTPVTTNGANLSGGQKQRLAIARALLHDTPVYIFDEATSNIDVESEEVIMRTIHTLAKSKTVILISHRLANVVKSDGIYMLKKGVVTEKGTHQQLLDLNGDYALLYKEQQELENYASGKEAAE